MSEPVLNKADMYRRIATGEFGNVLPKWYDFDAWCVEANPRAGQLWGVQHTKIAGFPGTRLNVDSMNVLAVVDGGDFRGENYCISTMIHQHGNVLWEGDVTREYISGNFAPAGGSWRRHMLKPRLISGSAARLVLRSLLNENSFDDLETLLDNYPDHVVELTALDCCYGTVPHRNGIVWEVRRY